MASYLEKTLEVAKYLDNCGTKDLRNHSSRNSSGTGTLIRLFRRLHSRIWSEMWSAVVCSKLASSSVPVLYLTGNWKWLRKAIASSPKEEYLERSRSMYHFATLLIRVRWNRRNWTESSLKELDEHHRWKVVTWSPKYLLGLPSNFGMSKGNLVSIEGQRGSRQIGSFNNLDKSGKCNVARNGSLGCWLCTGRKELVVWLALGCQEKLGC